MTKGKTTKWLHISDFHLYKDKTWDLFYDEYSKFFKKYMSAPRNDGELPIDFIIITGDMKDAMQKSINTDYAMFRNFLAKLVATLSITYQGQILSPDVFIVPGNHDANYEEQNNRSLNEWNEIFTERDQTNAWDKYLKKSEDAKIFTNYSENIIKKIPNLPKEYQNGEKRISEEFGKRFKINHKGRVEETRLTEWNNTLSILHLNTSLVNNWRITDTANDLGYEDVNNGKRTDTHALLGDAKLQELKDNRLPIIAIGHNKFSDLNVQTQTTLKQVFRLNNVSAYLCGDAHLKTVEEIDIGGGKHIPSVCCPKSSADDMDDYSHFGFILYSWDHDSNKVEVIPYKWVKDPVEDGHGMILPSTDFRVRNRSGDINNEYTFTMNMPHSKSSLEKHEYISLSSDGKARIDDNDTVRGYNIESGNWSKIKVPGTRNIAVIRKINEKICDGKNGKILVVIGDVMLDHYMVCKATEIRQSQRHDMDHDYSLDDSGYWRNEAFDSKLMGGAANVAATCNQVIETVKLFGITGNDGEGTDLFHTAINDLGEDNVCFTQIQNRYYPTITKIYHTIRYKSESSSEIGIRVNREATESVGSEIVSQAYEKGELNYLLETFKTAIDGADGVLFKDHEKGFLSNDKVFEEIVSIVNERLKKEKPFIVIVDPKYKWDRFKKLTRIDAILPNVKEMTAALYPDEVDKWKEREQNHSLADEDWDKMSMSQQWWNETGKVKCIAITEDNKGASLYLPAINSDHCNVVKNIYSVSPMIIQKNLPKGAEIGCGDVFDAYFVTCLLNKESVLSSTNLSAEEFYQYALKIANYAAGKKLTGEGSRALSFKSYKKNMFPPTHNEREKAI